VEAVLLIVVRLVVFGRLMMPDHAAGRGTARAMMMREMAGSAANDCTFDAALGFGSRRRSAKRKCQNRTADNHSHCRIASISTPNQSAGTGFRSVTANAVTCGRLFIVMPFVHWTGTSSQHHEPIGSIPFFVCCHEMIRRHGVPIEITGAVLISR
jgi:hypothetical protein